MIAFVPAPIAHDQEIADGSSTSSTTLLDETLVPAGAAAEGRRQSLLMATQKSEGTFESLDNSNQHGRFWDHIQKLNDTVQKQAGELDKVNDELSKLERKGVERDKKLAGLVHDLELMYADIAELEFLQTLVSGLVYSE
jgi:ABC-type transporter Mla subunit MlaD